jgi:glyoxylase-like metal-dependent hydrolase (beta-lactamase superfamily II)
MMRAVQRLKISNTPARVYAHTTSDGLNIGCIVTDEGVISIDLPLTFAEALAWRAEISQVTDKPLRGALFTSAHRVFGDALRALSHKPGTAILPGLVHETGFNVLFAQLEQQFQNRQGEPLSAGQLRERGVLPELTFSDSATFSLGGKGAVQFDVTRVGGFMPGSALVSIRGTDVVFAGDLVSRGAPPPIVGASNIDEWVEALAALKKSKTFKTLVPGIGPVGDLSAATETADYIKAAQTAVRKVHRANRSRDVLAVVLGDALSRYPAANRGLSAQQRALRGLEALFDAQPAVPVEG